MKLEEWLDVESEKCFNPDYVENEDRTKVRAEALGIRISQMLGWAGEDIGLFILRVLASGLEDANWHDVAAIVYDMIEKMENGASIGNALGIDELEDVPDN